MYRFLHCCFAGVGGVCLFNKQNFISGNGLYISTEAAQQQCNGTHDMIDWQYLGLMALPVFGCRVE